MSVVDRIRASGLTIYDEIPPDRPDLLISAEELELILETDLIGNNYRGLALRTRSKVVSQDICRALGYPVPDKFTKTKPRFFGQNFDKYVQKANNLQVWNEELDATRRYAVIRQDEDGSVSRVRVITGADLEVLDRTGTLAQKYQARLLVEEGVRAELISDSDTIQMTPLLRGGRVCEVPSRLPTDLPRVEELQPIQQIYESLSGLVGVEFDDAGSDQERNRGAALHCLVCDRLGYSNYADNGRFPDVRNQLLEVKLQTSPTIDLGLVLPSSEARLDTMMIEGVPVRHCDARYALFHGEIVEGKVRLDHFYLTTGEDFFTRFQQFEGKVLNKKLQIPLPSNFFDQ